MECGEHDFTFYNAVIQFLGIEHWDMTGYILLDECVLHFSDMTMDAFYGGGEHKDFIGFRTTIG
jgi:hypothetical protein